MSAHLINGILFDHPMPMPIFAMDSAPVDAPDVPAIAAAYPDYDLELIGDEIVVLP